MEGLEIELRSTAERHKTTKQQKKISGDGVKCYTTMTGHKTSICDLKPSDRLILTLERVSLTLDVLTNMSTSDTVTNSMKAFLKLRDQLIICRELPEYSDPASEQLEPWLSHLQDFKDKASAQCVQDAVMLNLISLRMQNVMCPSDS
ncbi:interferon lambda-3-like [Bufo gargarizans]|uniref:interferon lambda-3-like n=1 Tax=Bufo gargarizans TaxID=30331 RepID=UPI001CF10F42|nr:interferon lambda-3-like [Bufo gargarizans]